MNVHHLMQELKGFDETRYSVPELIALHSFGQTIVNGFIKFELDAPIEITDALSKIDAQIKVRTREQLEADLKELELEERRLMSREERKGELSERKSRLKARLGK